MLSWFLVIVGLFSLLVKSFSLSFQNFSNGHLVVQIQRLRVIVYTTASIFVPTSVKMNGKTGQILPIISLVSLLLVVSLFSEIFRFSPFQVLVLEVLLYCQENYLRSFQIHIYVLSIVVLIFSNSQTFV